MCAVFAGPFPAGFSQKEVRQLFRCCGPVHRIRMLRTAARVRLSPQRGSADTDESAGFFFSSDHLHLQLHAEIVFELLEGAALALTTLNGLNVQGWSIKVNPLPPCPSFFSRGDGVAVFHACVFQVRRPVHESLLDLEPTLDALACDHLNSSHLYAVKLTPAMSAWITEGASASAAKVNGAPLQHAISKTKLSEETARETFSRFGPVERVLLPTEPECRARRHARVRE